MQHPLPDRTFFGMMVTPFTDDDRIDEAALRTHLRRMVRAGIGVYMGAGGAGEGHTMGPEELARLFQVGVEECKGKVPVCATIPEQRTGAATIERCRLAMAAGVDAIQVFFPDAGHGMRPRAHEQERFYRDLLAKVDYPLCLSAHVHSGFLPEVKLLKSLCAEHPQVVAINAMVTPMSYVVELMDTLGPRVQVYVAARDMVNGLVLGANGCLAAEPNIIPDTCMRVLRAFEQGDLPAMREAFANLMRFDEVVNRWAPSTARWVKMAMKVLELPASGGPIREPYVLPGQADMEEMRLAFEKIGVRKFEGLA